jgi:hypothetical protein
MANPFWPLFDLQITTPRLEIRLPTDDELYKLLAVTDAGIHDPAACPSRSPGLTCLRRSDTESHLCGGGPSGRTGTQRTGHSLALSSLTANQSASRTSPQSASQPGGRSRPARGSGEAIKDRASARRCEKRRFTRPSKAWARLRPTPAHQRLPRQRAVARGDAVTRLRRERARRHHSPGWRVGTVRSPANVLVG